MGNVYNNFNNPIHPQAEPEIQANQQLAQEHDRDRENQLEPIDQQSIINRFFAGTNEPNEGRKVKKHFRLTKQAQITLSKLKSFLQTDEHSQQIEAVTSNIYYFEKSRKTYQGVFKNGKAVGKGIVHFEDGAYFYGDFEDNDANGNGIFIYANGSIYEGGFKDSYFNGYGSICYLNILKYVGYFKNGFPHGEGQQIYYKKKQCYIGQFEKGLKHGKGIYRWRNGDQYHGKFVSGQIDGYGQIIRQNKVVFQGYFKNGIKQGRGVLYKDQETIYGQFANDMLEGPGSVVLKSGAVLQGSFQNSRFDGDGFIYEKQRKVFSARWSKNKLKQIRVLEEGQIDVNQRISRLRHGYQN